MNGHYKFYNFPLPYAYAAMEPYIDRKTMMLHHSRHLQTYIDNLNEILGKYPLFQQWTLEQLLLNIASLPEKIQVPVKNNAGGVYNHLLYFQGLWNPSEGRPTGTLAEAVNQELGGYEEFREEFRKAALSVFGSGYAWLTVDGTGRLKIITTANQDTPLPLGLWPVLNLDVWEHAYYLKHYNVRADYIEDWFRVVNWKAANRNYQMRFESAG